MFKNYYITLTKQQKLNSNLFLISMSELKSNLETSITDIYSKFGYKESTEFVAEISKLSIESNSFVSKHKYNLSD